jgi:predicted GNAT family acetyltransferase
VMCPVALQDMEEGEEAKEAAAATWASLKRSTKCGPRRTVRTYAKLGSSSQQQNTMLRRACQAAAADHWQRESLRSMQGCVRHSSWQLVTEGVTRQVQQL